MRRREFIVGLGGAAAAWPFAAWAQQTPGLLTHPRIAFLGAESASTNQHFFDAFRQGMREHGYVDGQNVSTSISGPPRHSASKCRRRIAKSVFQVHGVDAAGQVVILRQLKRRYVLSFFQKLPQCLVGIAACASSHHWSRELQALGHTVRLMPPAYVKPYVKRQKNDATDAEAICVAVTRANMRFVPTKTPEQQSGLVLHRTRPGLGPDG